MRLLQNSSVLKLFEDQFQQTILRSAYTYIYNLHDPLRCNTFALVVRELIRIAMQRIAPDAEVKNTSWFVGYNKDKNKEVTRKERYRYAVSGYLSDDLILEHHEFDVSPEINALASAVDEPSKYTHISTGTYNISDVEAEVFKNKIEDAVIEYAEKLEGTQKRIQSKVWELTRDALTDEIINRIPDELDLISGQTIVEGVFIEEMQEMDLYFSSPHITGEGYVEVELNYGSNKDGVSHSDSYPLTFKATINHNTLAVTIQSITVDTSSFYE